VFRTPEGEPVTGAELAETTAAVAGRLCGAGAEPGDRVLMAAAPSRALVVAHVGALRAGLVVVPVNPALSRRELVSLIADARPKVVLAGPEAARWATEAGTGAVVSTPEVPLAQGPAPPLDRVEGADPGLILYTSGTTGRPKGVTLSHANLLAGAESVRLAWGWSAEDRLALALPLSHAHGLCIGLHGSLLAGSPPLVFDRFDPEVVLASVARGATMFFGVPTMYARLLEASRAGRLGGLRLCVSGSAPLDPGLHQALSRRTGATVLERYGTTETLLLASNPLVGERRAGTVGFPLPGVDLRLDEASGEILVRGPSVFAGYRDQPEADQGAFAGGWFRTGDIGAVEGGYLRIVGRSKEIIITGGYNVHPREVEDVLRGHPGVRDAAVVGVPSARWGEEVTAYVETDGALDVGSLRSYAGEQLAFYKRPRAVVVVEALPRTLLGKVAKDRLPPPDPPD
jgi:malonyl-CoA/methylmalonyl-CoA synthetase